MNKTEWFPPEIKPVYVGWYERDWSNSLLPGYIDWFDGKDWHNAGSPSPALNNKCWRGLSEPPHAD